MPNSIKYSVSAQTLALKKGNFWIGTGDVEKGPTSSTDYWSGIAPPASGYTIYLNKASQGPSIYQASNDSELIGLTNGIAEQSFTSVTECFNWYNTQSDKMVFNIDYPTIVTSGLVLNLDAGFRPSYSTSGTTWNDTSPSGNNGTLTNGPTYSSTDGGSIVLDGTDDYVDIGGPSSLNTIYATQEVWVKFGRVPHTGNEQIIARTNTSAGTFNIGKSLTTSKIFGNMRDSTNTFFQILSIDTINSGWNQLAITYNGTDFILYINGTQSISETVSNQTLNTGGTLVVNLGRNTTGAAITQGNLAIARVYNRGLSSSEILQNFNATKSRFGL